MKRFLQKHKPIQIIFLLIGVLSVFIMFFGNYKSNKNQTVWSLSSMREYTTNTPSTDCIICVEMGLHAREDNLGIICLNEREAYHVGINRYDKNGELIETKVTYNSFLVSPSTSEDNAVQIETNMSRGFANIEVKFASSREIDMSIVIENICADCLSQIVKDYYSVEPYGILIINYDTKDLKLITPTLKSFMLGNYYVTLEPRYGKATSEVSEIDMLVIHCPERY